MNSQEIPEWKDTLQEWINDAHQEINRHGRHFENSADRVDQNDPLFHLSNISLAKDFAKIILKKSDHLAWLYQQLDEEMLRLEHEDHRRRFRERSDAT